MINELKIWMTKPLLDICFASVFIRLNLYFIVLAKIDHAFKIFIFNENNLCNHSQIDQNYH
ncbi:hypothetical protein BpHYR1_054342 [Brachionus plicatilis]|uniref:Uncharacterized protein n=1 Tax=Brachionus plicatilis TaxID=10195 RepID=A0A3M7S3U4_BRAPC|nr:hypothetical protein BpHYR1_054342 [Brachionus plicatilis]